MTEAEAEKQKETLEQVNNEANDWRVMCKKCGAKLKGTFAQLRAHKC